MLSGRSRILWILPVLLAAHAIGQTNPSTQPSPAVEALVAQLNAPEFPVRQQAQQKLADMGPEIEPQLQQALATVSSDEARARLTELIDHFEEFRQLHASITMHFSNAPLQQVLDDFAKQSGADLGVDDPSVVNYAQGRTISIDLDNAGFWQALRAVDSASGLEPSIDQSGITLATGGPGRQMFQMDFASPYATIAGGLMIVPRYCQYMRMMDYHTRRSTAMLNLVIDVAPEPKMHVLSQFNMDWVKQCIDDKGNSLVPTSGARQRVFGRPFIGGQMMFPRGPRQWVWTMATNLAEVPDMGTTIAKLRGEISIIVQTRGQTFHIDDITRAKNVTATDGLINITVLSCSRMNQNYRLDLECVGPNINPADPSVQDFAQSVVLIDDQGQRIPLQSWSPLTSGRRRGAGPAALELMAIFQPTQNTPVRLEWDKTLEQKRLVVPFELDNLPME